MIEQWAQRTKGVGCRVMILALMLSGLVACDRSPESTPISGLPLPFDPGLVHRESALFADFAGNGRGLVKLGQGWYQQRYRSKLQRWQLDSWVGEAPSLYFLGPLAGDWDLIVRCAPFDDPQGRRQLMTPMLNGVELPQQGLEQGFQDLRIPLPAQHLKPSINELVLRFAWAVVPRDIGKGDEHRATAARVSAVAMAARGGEPEDLRSGGSVLHELRRELEIQPGSPVALPVDGRAEGGIELVSVIGAVSDSHLVVQVLGASGERLPVANGTPEELVGSVFSAPDGVTGPAFLVFGVENRRLGALRLGFRSVGGGDDSVVPPSLPSIFIYTVDTLRADALGVYGYPRPTSPRIDEFAAEAMTFERAWTPSPYTPPATMSLLTGLYPHRHGLVHAGQRPSGSLAPLLSERLARAGYETVAISQSYNIGPLYTFERGFETFYSNDAVARGASESADVPWFLFNHLAFGPRSERPLFAYIHVVDTHQPYIPQGADRLYAEQDGGSLREWKYYPEYFLEHRLEGDSEEVAHMRGLYDGEVLRADRQFGRFVDLLKALGLYDSSLVILTADHGEEFAEHRGFGHTRTLFEELVHVPLLVKLPNGQNSGRMVRTRASLTDVVPTALELAGLDWRELGLDGESLVNPENIDSDRTLLAETNPWAEEPRDGGWTHRRIDLRAAVRGDLKCIENRLERDRYGEPANRLQVFDLGDDPLEQRPEDLKAQRSVVCAQELQRLFDLGGQNGRESQSLTEEEKASLRALGYLR